MESPVLSTFIASHSTVAIAQCGVVNCCPIFKKFWITCSECSQEFNLLGSDLFIKHIKECLSMGFGDPGSAVYPNENIINPAVKSEPMDINGHHRYNYNSFDPQIVNLKIEPSEDLRSEPEQTFGEEDCLPDCINEKQNTEVLDHERLQKTQLELDGEELLCNYKNVPCIDVDTNTDESEPQQRFEYFTGAQRRRIAALIRDGIEPEEAKRLERARYAIVLAQRKKEKKEQSMRTTSKRCSSINTSPSETRKKHRPHTESRKDTCAATPEGDTKQQESVPKAHSDVVNSSSSDKIKGRKPKDSGDVNTAQERPSTSGLSNRDTMAHCKVAIMHAMHPEHILTNQEIKLVKKSLLEEMDKTDKNCPSLRFVATSARDGWWLITCHDTVTKNWLMSAVGRIKPWNNANLRGLEVPKLFACLVYVPEGEYLTKDVFLARIAKQNTGVTTNSWRVLRITKEKSGGETITFAVDEDSKDYILSQACKLFLNFSQVLVTIKE